MATDTETLALHIMRDLYRTTEGAPQRWRGLSGLSSSAGTEEAVAYAVKRGWLLLERGHSIALTDKGRRKVRP